MKVVIAAVLLLTFASLPARAEPAWEEKLPDPQRAHAMDLYREGRSLFDDGFNARAALVLSESLASWDHPVTHLMLAKVLIKTERPVDAIKHLWASMRYRGHPMTLEQIEQVEWYSKLLLQYDLARLVVRSEIDRPVYLFDERVLEGPGTWEGLVRVGGIQVGGTVVQVSPRTSHSVVVRDGSVEPADPHALVPSEIASLQRTLVGFEPVFPTTEERLSWPGVNSPHRNWFDEEAALPAPAHAICARAKSKDLMTVCRQFAEERKTLGDQLRRSEDGRKVVLERFRRMIQGASNEPLQ